jgi:TonB family protein
MSSYKKSQSSLTKSKLKHIIGSYSQGTVKQVTRKAIVVTKPEPTYTDAARENEVTGTVVLRGIFASSGAVTNIRVMAGLPDGLTENAIAAARQIKFIPAIKDGHFVSMYIQLEYNFNLY